MTDGQSEYCALNGPFSDPDYDPDLPFGRGYEQRRLDRQKDEQRPGWVEETRRLIKEQDEQQDRREIVAELREEIRRYEQAAIARRERH